FIRPLKGYYFVNKDPVIDKLRTIVQDSGESYQAIQDMGGAKASSLYNWFHGDVKRPQFATVNATARVLGHELVFMNKQTDAIVRIPARFARAASKRRRRK